MKGLKFTVLKIGIKKYKPNRLSQNMNELITNNEKY